jgi:hypothetical protein
MVLPVVLAPREAQEDPAAQERSVSTESLPRAAMEAVLVLGVGAAMVVLAVAVLVDLPTAC